MSAPGAPLGSYYVQDHLGNTRVVYEPVFCGEQTNGEAMSYAVEYVGDYFPYGKTIREYVSGKKEKFLTTEHERDVETGLDYRGARFYDADIGRFLSLDPLASDYPQVSAYNYVLGNPILLIDPSGRSPEESSGWTYTNAWLASNFNGSITGFKQTWQDQNGEKTDPVNVTSENIITVQHNQNPFNRTSTVNVNNGAIADFVQQINSFAGLQSEGASLTLAIEIPYITQEEFSSRTNAQKRAKVLRDKIASYNDLGLGLRNYYDQLSRGRNTFEIPTLIMEGVDDGYDKMIRVLGGAGIRVDVQIEMVRIQGKSSRCKGNPSEFPCSNPNVCAPKRETKMKLIFRGRAVRA
ncbi:MAG: RHS repeat-associated core domain-containing protein [Saprospiraceae bacterium]